MLIRTRLADHAKVGSKARGAWDLCPRWLLPGLPIIVSVWALVCGLDATGAYAAPELDVLSQGAIEVKAVEGKDTAEAFVTILNTGDELVTVSVGFQPAVSGSIKATLAGSPTIDPRNAANIGVRFSGLKGLTSTATGQIVIQGGVKPVAQSATITPALQPLLDWPLAIISTSLGVSLVLVGWVALSAGKKRDAGLRLLFGPAPGPKWSFDSWATHLTAVGALLGTVLGAATLPAVPMQIDKESLVALSLLFAGLAVAGPFVFQAIRSPDAKAEDGEEGNWGYVWGLLIACWLTLGAVLGEVATLGLAGWVITGGGAGAVALEAGLFVLICLASYYVVTTAKALALVDWTEVAEKAKKAKEVNDAPDGGFTLQPRPAGSFGYAGYDALGDNFRLFGVRQELAEKSSRASRHLDIGPDGQAQDMTLRMP